MIGTQSGAIGRNEMKITAERRPQNGGFCGCVLLLCRVQTMKRHNFNWIIAFIADKACGVVPVAA